MSKVTFHHYKPATLSIRDVVIGGLSRRQKSIPPKCFYDQRGSTLFEKICEHPEYYPPSVERRILARW